MDLGLEGRCAIVFGSTSGLGRAIAESLAVEGAKVAIVGRRADVAADIAGSLPGAVAVTGDITVDGEPARIVGEAAAALGGLDICVVNTGGGKRGGMTEVSTEDEAGAFASMLQPALAISRTVGPYLQAGGDGRLLYITARSVVEAAPELALSGVFRSGVAAAARVLALELAPEVLVNVVVPGQFDTPALARAQTAQAEAEGSTVEAVRARHRASSPMDRFGRAQELADVVVFLASARASFVNGSVVRVDGGAVRGY